MPRQEVLDAAAAAGARPGQITGHGPGAHQLPWVFVFVHDFATTFEQAIRRASQMKVCSVCRGGVKTVLPSPNERVPEDPCSGQPERRSLLHKGPRTRSRVRVATILTGTTKCPLHSVAARLVLHLSTCMGLGSVHLGSTLILTPARSLSPRPDPSTTFCASGVTLVSPHHDQSASAHRAGGPALRRAGRGVFMGVAGQSLPPRRRRQALPRRPAGCDGPCHIARPTPAEGGAWIVQLGFLLRFQCSVRRRVRV